MAKPLNEDSGIDTANAGNRAAVIQEVIRDILSLEAQRKKISDEIRELKSERIKGGLGMKIADFNIALRLYKLENEDRDQMLDTVRECFEALGVGEQLDWLKASERAAA